MFGKQDESKVSKKELKQLEKQRKQAEKEQALLDRYGANEKDYLRRLYDLSKVLMEQNFILIRQLDEISSKLK